MSAQATAFGTQGRSWGFWSPERRRPGGAVGLPAVVRCGWRIGLGLGLGLGMREDGLQLVLLAALAGCPVGSRETLCRLSAHAYA